MVHAVLVLVIPKPSQGQKVIKNSSRLSKCSVRVQPLSPLTFAESLFHASFPVTFTAARCPSIPTQLPCLLINCHPCSPSAQPNSLAFNFCTPFKYLACTEMTMRHLSYGSMVLTVRLRPQEWLKIDISTVFHPIILFTKIELSSVSVSNRGLNSYRCQPYQADS